MGAHPKALTDDVSAVQLAAAIRFRDRALWTHNDDDEATTFA